MMNLTDNNNRGINFIVRKIRVVRCTPWSTHTLFQILSLRLRVPHWFWCSFIADTDPLL